MENSARNFVKIITEFARRRTLNSNLIHMIGYFACIKTAYIIILWDISLG